jgi:hypothetical protein
MLEVEARTSLTSQLTQLYDRRFRRSGRRTHKAALTRLAKRITGRSQCERSSRYTRRIASDLTGTPSKSGRCVRPVSMSSHARSNSEASLAATRTRMSESRRNSGSRSRIDAAVASRSERSSVIGMSFARTALRVRLLFQAQSSTPGSSRLQAARVRTLASVDVRSRATRTTSVGTSPPTLFNSNATSVVGAANACVRPPARQSLSHTPHHKHARPVSAPAQSC